MYIILVFKQSSLSQKLYFWLGYRPIIIYYKIFEKIQFSQSTIFYHFFVTKKKRYVRIINDYIAFIQNRTGSCDLPPFYIYTSIGFEFQRNRLKICWNIRLVLILSNKFIMENRFSLTHTNCCKYQYTLYPIDGANNFNFLKLLIYNFDR